VSGIFKPVRCEVIMLNVAAYKTGPLAVCVCLLLAACATPRTQEDTREIVKTAEAAFSRFARDPDMRWMQENLPKAKGVVICPRILQAGFIIGGAGGRCVVVARRGSAGWSGPAFYKMGTGSLGFQAGAQESEMVVLAMTDKAVNSLLATSFKLGGDVSIAAGPIGAGAGAPVTADMVSFVRSKGLYGGINLDGTVITVDDNANQAFYGRSVTPVDVLIKGSASSSLDDTLVRAVSRAAGHEGRR
jgi:lipid-binding SYLF domain-containing protein